MNMRIILLLVSVSMLLTPVVAKRHLYVRKAPKWSAELPDDTAFIYGVGMASVKGDLEVARKRAEKDALLKVSQTLSSVIKGSIKTSMQSVSDGSNAKTIDSYDEEIALFTQSTLTDCKIINAAIVKKDNTYWVLAALDKAAYDKKMNAHLHNAVAIATEALEATYPKSLHERVSFLSIVNRLEQGLDALKDFWGRPMKATINGSEVILNVEIPRRFEKIFSEIRIKSRVKGVVQVTSSGELSDTVGVHITWNGHRVSDVPIRWEANKSVQVKSVPNRDGFAQLAFTSIQSGDGIVTMKAMPDLNSLVWKLKNRGVPVGGLSSAEIRVQKAPQEVYVLFGSETRLFVQWLSSRGEVIVSQNSGMGLELKVQQENPKLSRGLFNVRTQGTLKIQGAYNRVETVSVVGVGRSESEAAQRSLEELYKKLLQHL